MELNYGSDEHFMREALKEAKEALAADEIPVGAVIVHSGKIIARGRNMTEKLNDVTAHAEMLCFTSAANYMNSKYLKDCTLYVTLGLCDVCRSFFLDTNTSHCIWSFRRKTRLHNNSPRCDSQKNTD